MFNIVQPLLTQRPSAVPILPFIAEIQEHYGSYWDKGRQWIPVAVAFDLLAENNFSILKINSAVPM